MTSDASESSSDLRRDAGDPNRDRTDLADLPPTQVDDDVVQEHLAEEESSDNADHDDLGAAR